PPASVFPGPIAFNVLPHAGAFDGDETVEELKFRNESRKILDIPDLAVSATCVRVPAYTGHSMALNATFERPMTPERALERRSGRSSAGRRAWTWLTRRPRCSRRGATPASSAGCGPIAGAPPGGAWRSSCPATTCEKGRP